MTIRRETPIGRLLVVFPRLSSLVPFSHWPGGNSTQSLRRAGESGRERGNRQEESCHLQCKGGRLKSSSGALVPLKGPGEAPTSAVPRQLVLGVKRTTQTDVVCKDLQRGGSSRKGTPKVWVATLERAENAHAVTIIQNYVAITERWHRSRSWHGRDPIHATDPDTGERTTRAVEHGA